MEVKIVVIIHGVTNGEQAKGAFRGATKIYITVWDSVICVENHLIFWQDYALQIDWGNWKYSNTLSVHAQLLCSSLLSLSRGWLKNNQDRDFFGSAVVRILCAPTVGSIGLILGQGTKIPHARSKAKNKDIQFSRRDAGAPIVLLQE